MTCQYLPTARKCSLGLYGGNPHPVNCEACMRAERNNPEFAKELFAKHELTHPPNVRKVSGCCDSAENPPL